MKRKITFLLSALCAVMMVAQPMKMVGQTYKKAVSISVGDIVVFVAEGVATQNGYVGVELSSISTTSTKYGKGTDFETTPAGTMAFEVVSGNTEGTFAFKNGSNYLYWTSGNSLATNSTLSNNTSWTVTISNGNATIINAYDNTRQIWWNVSSPRFACYVGKENDNSYKYVQIYKKAYTVTYAANGGTGTMTDSNSPYFKDATVTLLDNAFTAPDNKVFDGWIVTNASSATVAVSNNQFTMPASNVTVTAQWADAGGPTTYTLTITPPTGGTITVLDDEANEVSSGDKFEEGTELTLEASASTGYTFSAWTGTTSAYASTSNANTTFTMPASTATIAATFTANTHSLTLTSDHGTCATTINGVTWDGSSKIPYGAAVVVTATPNTDYQFSSWTCSYNIVTENGNEISFTMPDADVTLTANYSVIPTHTAQFSVNGTIDNSNNCTVAEGAAITFPSNPSVTNGRTFVGWAAATINGTTDSAPTFVASATMGNSDVTYYAVFAKEGMAKSDQITSSVTGITTSSYSDFSNKTISGGSGAKYAGNCAGSNTYIQLRTSSNTGMVSTTSGGKAVKVTVDWYSQLDRALLVYGKNSAYTGLSDLFNDDEKGTLLGTLTYGSDTELTITGNYNYIGVKPASDKAGMLQFYSITIDWTPYSGYCTTVPAQVFVTGITLDKSYAIIYNESGYNTVQLTPAIAPNDATMQAVTWTSSNTSKATVSSTGLVKAVAEGSATITVTTTDGNFTASCDVTIKYPHGTAGTPYTVAEALDVIDGLANNGTVSNKYVSGIISRVGSYNSTAKSITYWISVDGTTSSELQVYKGMGIGGANFSAASDLKVNDQVVVFGQLKKYKSGNTITPEFNENSQIVSLIRPGTGGDPDQIAGTLVTLTIESTDNYIVANGQTLEVTDALTNNGTAANLVIEDGGQLITSSSVQLTYKKNITSAAKDGGWYTISTPVHTASNTFLEHESVENLILASEQYDFFYYDEPSNYWRNYKKHEFDLNVSQGYLYRNNGAELHFAGNNNQATYYEKDLSYASTEPSLLGFNLIGNPYPQNITMSDVTVNNEGTLTGGYVLSNAGAWSADVAATIAPAQGFLVQIDKAGVTARITKPTGGSKSRANHDYLKFIVANSQYEDAAYALFDKGYGLNKIDHRNADIPMLYIPKDKQNFAIATMSDDTKSFNLNFKAMTTGKYTLSYKATGTYSYLHVIDRLTGEDVDMLLEGEYSFIASPSDAENRFIVRLEYSAGSESPESSVFAYQSGNDIIVNGEGELQIFDMMGRRVSTQYVSGVETINLQLSGVYVFRLNDKTQKIVVK